MQKRKQRRRFCRDGRIALLWNSAVQHATSGVHCAIGGYRSRNARTRMSPTTQFPPWRLSCQYYPPVVLGASIATSLRHTAGNGAVYLRVQRLQLQVADVLALQPWRHGLVRDALARAAAHDEQARAAARGEVLQQVPQHRDASLVDELCAARGARVRKVGVHDHACTSQRWVCTSFAQPI